MAVLAKTLSPNAEHMAELAEVFHLMGDPSRLGILMSVAKSRRLVQS